MMATSNPIGSWQCNKTVLERNSIMLERQINTDVTFVFPRKEGSGERSQEQQTIGAHKYMLESSSPVFWSMLNGGLTEKGPITVKDINYDTFGTILRFIYCEDIDLTGDTVMQVLYASKKYIIPALSEICSVFLQEHIDARNACTILDQAIGFNEEQLSEMCMGIIAENTVEVLKSEEFLTASASCLERILQCDKLSASEVEIFEACMAWAKYSCKGGGDDVSGNDLRLALGNVLYKIRFPAMSVEDFSSFVSPAGVLSKDEEILCYRYIGNPRKVDLDSLPFLTDKRSYAAKIIRLLHPVESGPCPVLNGQVGSKLERRYQLRTSAVTHLVGFRILCKVSDTVSLSLTEITQGQRCVPNSTEQQITVHCINTPQTLGSFYSTFGYGNTETLHSGIVTQTKRKHNLEFTDICFEERAVQLTPEMCYELKVSFAYETQRYVFSPPCTQQYIQTQNSVFKNVEFLGYAQTFDPQLQPGSVHQGALFITGIFTKSPK